MSYITQRVADQLFQAKHNLEHPSSSSTTPPPTVTVRVGFVEIYREQIRDLVDGARNALGLVHIQVRQRAGKGVFLDGARERIVTNHEELMQIVREGGLVRQTAATGMNASSSRSHSIITLTVQIEGSGANSKDCLAGKLHLVDLAGSERVKRTAVVGERFAEGVEINKGLFALAKVISALAERAGGMKKLHVPYRDSKLTRLLQDSLGGNARTLLVACVSPADSSREETLGTLRYAERAKSIRNRPKVNTERDSVEVSDLRAALARAKAEIAGLVAENERLRRGLGRRWSSESLSEDRAASCSGSSGQLSPLPGGSLVVTRDDDVVNGLKYRITVLEGVLERANLSKEDREALLLGMKGEQVSMTHSPLGRLKNVGFQSLAQARRTDCANRGWRADGSAKSPAGASRKRQRAQRVRARDAVGGAVNRKRENIQGLKSASLSICNNDSRRILPRRRGLALSVDDSESSPSSRPGQEMEPSSEITTTEKSDDSSSDVVGLDHGSGSEENEELISSRVSEMRRTFLKRLTQAEEDKRILEEKSIQAMKRMAALQKKHEKEIDQLKSSFNIRVGDMRSKLVDVKRLEAESTRLMKLRDGSDASRKKLVAKLKGVEKERDEVMSKLAQTSMQLETVRKTLGKENRNLSKTEKGLRTELKRIQAGKARQDAIVHRLRVENEEMKVKLRNAGRQPVRRVNSGLTPATARASATC